MNKFQTVFSQKYLDNLPQEIQEQYYDCINNVPYIHEFIKDDRLRAKDLPKDKDGKVIIDVTKPHILEDMDYFRPSAIHYQKYGCFTNLKPNANPNSEYGKWIREEVRRCWEGYVRPSDGEWITGDYYFFLNYCPIQLIKKDEKGNTIRTIDFPKVWDGHYLKSHYLLQCRLHGHHAAELASRGKGKAHPLDEKIYTPFGETTFKNIRVGSVIFGEDGKPTKVIKIPNKGKFPMFEITFENGEKVQCSSGHLWNIFEDKEWFTVPASFINRELQKNNKKTFLIPVNKCVEFNKQYIKYNPYEYGLYLGNNKKKIFEDIKFEPTKKKMNRAFLFNTFEIRLEVLKGIIKANGKIIKNGVIEFVLKSRRLIKDIRILCGSLGITYSDVSADTIKENYLMHIYTDLFFEDKTFDKDILDRIQYNKIISIKFLGKKHGKCITVDNESNLYLIDNFIVTHNSYFGASLLAKRFILGESKSVNKKVQCVATASERKYIQGANQLLDMFQSYIDFCANNTEFPRQRITSSLQNMSWTMGYIDSETNTRRGTENSVIGITSKDDESKLRGSRGVLYLLEESGTFPRLLNLYQVLRPSVEDGNSVWGTIFLYGTAGDSDSDFSSMQELMYNPKGYNIESLENIYDKEGQGRKAFAFFFPGYLNRADCYDDNGNSDVTKALMEILQDRYQVKYNSTDINAITKRIAEIPITPQEAILKSKGNIFPIADLTKRLNEIDNNPNFYDDTYVGDLVFDKGGTVSFEITNKTPIHEFPTKDNKIEGAIEIFEMPKKINEKIPNERYILSCLPKGEKINTSNGLKNVEDITINDKLINKDGKEVNIINCQQYYNNKEVYNIKLSSIFDSTKFTHNHPIYCATPKVHYHNANVCRKYNLKQKYYTYDFNFKQAQDVKIGDYVKTPILYQEVKNIFHYWQDHSRIDKKIENPLNKEDFWYLIGVILGDGWAASDGYNIGIIFNKKEKYLINKCKEIVSKIFNRKFSKIGERESTVTYQFSCSYFNNFFKQYFGVNAENKFIFNDFKYIRQNLKKALILGYIDTDGCIKNSGVEIVSISKRLLNDIQDILFSLQIISSVHLLRKKETHYIVDRYSLCKNTYTLHIGKIGTSKIYDWNLSSMKIPTFKGYTTIDHNKKYSFIKDGYLYLRIMNVTKENYKGVVYNFACDTHTFMCNYIPTHNCDNYENDSAESMSLGSILVLDLWTDRIVAEYTGRPQFVDELNEICRKMCMFYNGKVMVENNKKNTFAYFSKMNSLHLMADTPEYLKNKQILKATTFGNSSKGCPATIPVINFAMERIKDWLLKPVTTTEEVNGEPLSVTVPNLYFIKNRALLKELMLYNPAINVDRIMSLCQLMLYREEKMILYQGNPEKVKNKTPNDYLGNDPYFNKNYDKIN